MTPRYLGDGVYAKTDKHGRVVLTTGSHYDMGADNIIIFEPEVLSSLMLFIGDLSDEQAKVLGG